MPRWMETRDDATLANAASTLFRSYFSEDPEGVWAAPGRVNVIGDHVDYAGGISIPFALKANTAIALRRSGQPTYRVVSLAPGQHEASRVEIPINEVGPGSPDNWAGYVVGAIWAAIEAGVIPCAEGLDMAIVSDVPVGSGLSSSAALECSAALGSLELATGRSASEAERTALVDACIRAENEVVGASTGGLDQRASLFGQEGKALVIDFQEGSTTLVPFDLSGHGLALLIADTNAPHALNDGQYASRRGVIDDVTAAMGAQTLREVDNAVVRAASWANAEGRDAEVTCKRVKHVVEETDRTAEAAKALERDDLNTFAKLMRDSHESLRDQYEVVTPELESVFQTVGSRGSRMTGGGFGGSVITIVAEDEVAALAERIAQAAEAQGFPEPSFMVATPGAGARRLV
ncbi:galactokinase [Corynebacterium pseudopelargi]|uniref:Galactokinase n=1 Tax=Corynebacterium pseudopelargi TaxID=2080757 RepID=A0A3G6IXY7_9CORY|nr:galactokinase [Corynebacterium pseudopelargi]AZA09518.1 Galactokinase [Corynebacterium pseudopelargi]